MPVPVGRAVGGTTVINSGTALRAPEQVLKRWRDRHGIEWATGLEAEFADAEKALAVVPVDAARMGRNGQLFMDGAEAMGRAARRCAQRRPLRPVQLVPKGMPPRRQACDARRPTCRAPSRPALGVRAASRWDRVLLEGSRAAGVSASWTVRVRRVLSGFGRGP